MTVSFLARHLPIWNSARGRDFQFAVDADSRHTIRLRLKGRSLRPRTHHADPLLAFAASTCATAAQRLLPVLAAR
jgi:hypothetical protein